MKTFNFEFGNFGLYGQFIHVETKTFTCEDYVEAWKIAKAYSKERKYTTYGEFNKDDLI